MNSSILSKMFLIRCILLIFYIPVITHGTEFSLNNFSLSRQHVVVNIHELVLKWKRMKMETTNFVVNDLNPNLLLINRALLEINTKFSMIEFGIPRSAYRQAPTEEERDYEDRLLAHALGNFNKHGRGKPLSATINFLADELNSTNSDFHTALKMAKIANSIHPGTITGLQLDAQNEKQTITKILKNVQLANVGIAASGIPLRLSVLTKQVGQVCANDTQSDKLRAKIVELIDELNISTEWNCNDVLDKNEKSAFKDVTLQVEKCESNVKLVSRRELSVKVTSICYFSEVLFDKIAHFWWLLSEYAKAKNRTVVMLESFDPIISEFIYSSGWKEGDETSDASFNKSTKNTTLDHRTSLGAIFQDNIVILIVVSIVCSLAIGIWMQFRRNQKMKRMLSLHLSKGEIMDFFNGNNSDGGRDSADQVWNSRGYDAGLEIKRNDFFVDPEDLLGSGTSGCVFGGTLSSVASKVAFKTVRRNADCHSGLMGLLSEIKILAYIGKHDHIVNILGAYTAELDKGVVYIAMELCSRGSLNKYLHMLRNSSSSSDYLHLREEEQPEPDIAGGNFLTVAVHNLLIKFAVEICDGMKYIASKKVVHADLAARNVLLTSGLTAKISDFGLSLRMNEYANYVKKNQEPLPWKWLAPESLMLLEFSEKSDVWAYAVTLWEIFSLGISPYPGLTWHADFVSELQHGLRLQRPESCPPEMYGLMENCWQWQKEGRPIFSELFDSLTKLVFSLSAPPGTC